MEKGANSAFTLFSRWRAKADTLSIRRFGWVELTLAFYIVTLLCFKHGGIESLICAGSFFLFVLVALGKLISRRRLLTANLSDKFIVWTVVFWLFAYSSFIWSGSFEAVFDPGTLKKAVQIIAVSLLLVMISQTEERYSDKLLKTVVAAFAVSSLVILSSVSFSNLGMTRLGNEETGVNANSLGLLYAIAAVMAVDLFRREKKPVWLILFALFYFIVLLTGTRQALIFPVIYFAALLLLNANRMGAYVAAAVFLIAVMVFYHFLMTDETLYLMVGSRLERLVQSVLGVKSVSEGSLNERTMLRQLAFDQFLGHPILGMGLNGFGAWLMGSGSSTAATSHCNYTELLSCLGVIGFVVYYYMYGYCIRRLIMQKRMGQNGADHVAAVLIAMLVTQFGGEVLTNIGYVVLFCLFYLQMKDGMAVFYSKTNE